MTSTLLDVSYDTLYELWILYEYLPVSYDTLYELVLLLASSMCN